MTEDLQLSIHVGVLCDSRAVLEPPAARQTGLRNGQEEKTGEGLQVLNACWTPASYFLVYV